MAGQRPAPLAETPQTADPSPEADGPERPDAARLGRMLGQIARIGSQADGAVSRLGFTRLERDAHALVGGWLSELGLEVRVDEIGNTIAELSGTRADAPAIGVGSHLDSVPHGGRYDGIVGVVGAVELVRLLSANRAAMAHHIRVVIFAGEEGARFGEPCIGSKAAAGLLADADLSRLLDGDGMSLADALRSIDLDPKRVRATRWRSADWAAFLELHIEQARVLETSDSQVGLVDIVSGSTRLSLDVIGRSDHSGGTPMNLRADALVAASEIVLAAEALAQEPRNRGARLTVGRLEVHPNSITTIPGQVRLALDVRDVDSDRQRALAMEIAGRAHDLAERRGVAVQAEPIADTSPAVLPIWIRQLMSQVCEDLGVRYRVMSSGAGHDAQIVNRITPAGMILVPSRGGLSHVPEEWTSASDVARGVEVLYHSVLKLDEILASFGHDGSPTDREA
jgi:allantoate deiminase